MSVVTLWWIFTVAGAIGFIWILWVLRKAWNDE